VAQQKGQHHSYKALSDLFPFGNSQLLPSQGRPAQHPTRRPTTTPTSENKTSELAQQLRLGNQKHQKSSHTQKPEKTKRIKDKKKGAI